MRLRAATAHLYKPLHASLFEGWKDEWFAPGFVHAARKGNRAEIESIVTELVPGVFSFELFKPSFCDMLQEELNVRCEPANVPVAVLTPV